VIIKTDKFELEILTGSMSISAQKHRDKSLKNGKTSRKKRKIG
jgi:hypothetical protein